MSTTTTNVSTETAYSLVADSYGYRALNSISPALRQKIALSLGYNPKDTTKIPEEANLGEGCGNPLAIASLVEGEKVLDLGCGGGFDVLQASQKVGSSGKVFGVDMTLDMISLAKRNAEKMGVTNVELIHCNINKLPFANGSMDCVISNCVLNLVPENDKLEVLREIHRVLRPCGRLAVSDFLALKPLSAEIKADTDLQTGCVSGAMEVGKMENYLHALGFDDLLLVDTKKDLNMYKDGETAKSITPCCAAGSSCKPGITESGRKVLDYDLNEWISSFQIYGHKWCGKTKQNVPQVTSVALQGESAPITGVTNACKPSSGCC